LENESKLKIEALLNETNLRWNNKEKEVSALANGIFESYKESLMFGKYKGIQKVVK
jgi:hypothetical protein